MTDDAKSPSGGAQVEPTHYDLSYDSKRRFISYWNQIHQVLKLAPKTVLEVGIGNGFVSRYLRFRGVELHTVDYDERLGPDTACSVTDMPFEDRKFEVACCFETLEHLPWVAFVPALKELRRVASRNVLVSLPDVTPFTRVYVQYKFRKASVDIAEDRENREPKPHRYNGQHFWEIGKEGTPLSRVVEAFGTAGLRVVDIHRDYDDPYHRFFITEPV